MPVQVSSWLNLLSLTDTNECRDTTPILRQQPLTMIQKVSQMLGLQS